MVRPSYVTVDIASLVISLCDNASDAGQSATYRGADHASLRCRPTAIRRAIANLIDNGCKYGHEVTVTLTDESEALAIAIADRGPGIAPGDVETAFKPFHRLESSRNRATGGTGHVPLVKSAAVSLAVRLVWRGSAAGKPNLRLNSLFFAKP
jgi:signal transduction histidine kinase